MTKLLPILVRSEAEHFPSFLPKQQLGEIGRRSEEAKECKGHALSFLLC